MPQSITCPICERETTQAAFYRYPYLVPEAVELIRKIQPRWQDGDGCCNRCVDSVLKTLDDAEGQAERLDAQTGFRAYYRRVLTSHESRMWHHVNPDMARWRRKVILEETGVAADKVGFDAFVIFDVDEGLLTQGAG